MEDFDGTGPRRPGVLRRIGRSHSGEYRVAVNTLNPSVVSVDTVSSISVGSVYSLGRLPLSDRLHTETDKCARDEFGLCLRRRESRTFGRWLNCIVFGMAVGRRGSDGVSHALTRLKCVLIPGRPRQYGSGWLSLSPAWTSKPVKARSSVRSLATAALIGVADSFVDVARTLPPHLLLSMIYRVTVLHLAARIVPALRINSMGWDDGMDPTTPSSFWDGRSLGQEPPVSDDRRSND